MADISLSHEMSHHTFTKKEAFFQPDSDIADCLKVDLAIPPAMNTKIKKYEVYEYEYQLVCRQITLTQ